MGIERHLLVAAALLTTLGAGCGPIAARCSSGTLVVAVSLDSAAATADELAVAISLDGGTAQETTLAHAPGTAVGNVVVEFPRGYPSGSVVAVAITARAGGAVVGAGNAAATLSGSCQSTTLDVLAAGDDAATDMIDDASSGDDLTDVDLTTPPDFRPPPPDLYCPGGGVELCFNGTDDDCDGLVDCADPDCAPVAVCVPAVTTPFVYGTQEPQGAACPANTSGGARYQADGMGGGCTGNCGCAASGCSATLSQRIPCPGGAVGSAFATLTHGNCTNVEDVINFTISGVGGTLSCPVSGAAAPVTPPTLTTAVECTMASAVTGGCAVGQVCAVRGTKQCVSAPAANVTCPSGYPTSSPTWYQSYNDSRTCSCSCATGSCAAASVNFFDSKSCGGTATPKSGDDCNNSLLGAKLVGGCTSTTNFANPLTFNVPSTVCCQ